MLRRDESAATAVVATVLLLGVTVTGGAVYLVESGKLSHAAERNLVSDGLATYGEAGYVVALLGPDDVPLDGSHLTVTIDGQMHRVDLQQAAPQTADGRTWKVGERICVAGNAPCLLPAGNQVSGLVIHRERVVFDLLPLMRIAAASAPAGGGAEEDPTWLSFVVDPTGALEVQCDQDVLVHVLGKQLNLGVGGPAIPVRIHQTLNGVAPYTAMFGGNPVAAAQQTTLHAPAGSDVGLRFNADRAGFHSERFSVNGGGYVKVLTDGSAVPDVPAFGHELSLAAFVAPYVDVANGVMDLDANEAILLVEFGDSLTGAVADFQDLVVLLQFEPSC